MMEILNLFINGVLFSIFATKLAMPPPPPPQKTPRNTNTHQHSITRKCRVSSVPFGLADQQIF